jgi:RNase P/RNase MRP subunit p29
MNWSILHLIIGVHLRVLRNFNHLLVGYEC